jgi:hypothetical protein
LINILAVSTYIVGIPSFCKAPPFLAQPTR